MKSTEDPTTARSSILANNPTFEISYGSVYVPRDYEEAFRPKSDIYGHGLHAVLCTSFRQNNVPGMGLYFFGAGSPQMCT